MHKIVTLSSLFLVSMLLLVPAGPAEADLDLEGMRSSVIQVITTSQSEDYYTPWQRPRAQGSGGSAFYIGNNLLMTNGHVVADSKNLEIKRASKDEEPADAVG